MKHKVPKAVENAPATVLAADQRYRAVMQAAVDAIITITDKGIVMDFNPAAERIFGYRADEVLGRNVSMLMPEPYRSNHDGYLERYARLRETRVLGRIRAVHGRRRNGELFPIELSLAECQDLERTLFVGILRDLSELEWAQNEVRQYTERLRQSTEELESLTVTATHDLREPLRKVNYFMERLRLLVSTHGAEQDHDSVKRILDAASRMQTLLDDLSAYATSAYTQRAPEVTDLSALARDALRDLDGRIEQSGATIHIGDLPTLAVEPVPMRHVLENLVGNALKYRNPRVAPQVWLEAAPVKSPGDAPPDLLGAQWWELRVQDNGIGIAPEHQARIFEMFQRLHNRTEFPGTGVGLALCRKVVLRHSGTIRVESELGAGACFIITLPDRPGQAPPNDQPTTG